MRAACAEVLFAVWFVLPACAARTDLWPPVGGQPRHVIYVSLDTWHGMIGYHLNDGRLSSFVSRLPPINDGALGPRSSADDARADPPHPDVLYEEWGYAERAWYVEGRQGAGGILRALFWPTAGTVEISRARDLWAARTVNPPADLFMFELTGEGFERLRRHLRGTIAESTTIGRTEGSRFYPSVRSYHLFHHCHQYVAIALQEAGLPVSSAAAITRTTLAWQLRRAERAGHAPAAGTPAPAGRLTVGSVPSRRP